MGWRQKAHRSKRLHRPSLKNWEVDGLYRKFPAFVHSILDRDRQSSITDLPEIIDAHNVEPKEFWERYEAKGVPCLISNLLNGNDGAGHDWPALRRWDLDSLKSDHDLRSQLFKVGEDDDGRSIKMKLKHFIRYLRKNQDDSPLYIFDSAFDEDKYAKRLLNDYSVSAYFSEDLFHLVGEKRRPPYRWFLVGPKRSGTTVHIDPLGTR